MTHPLSISGYATYAAFQADNSGKFKPFAADGEMTLDATGNISCSTCHGAHFTDSDAATTDGPGQTLSAGDGAMLKGNGTMTGNPTSLCTSCHIYKAHGGGSVGCIDCHSGHSYNNGSPNYFVLRDTVSKTPTNNPATNPGTNLVYNSLTYPWMNGGAGYCEGCHNLGASHNSLSAGGADAATCGSCHSHDDASAAFTAGDCSSCHGYPPSQAPGAAAGYTGNEATAPHGIHAEATSYDFDCSFCHTGNTHNAGTFQDVGFSGTAALTGTQTYTAGTTDCSSVYCHGNGRTGAGFVPANQTWAGGINGINGCTACHGNDGTTMTTAGNTPTHQKHLAKGYDCSLCHNSTATGPIALVVGADKAGGTHVNGTADVVFDGASSLTQLNAANAVYGTDGTCQNVYCHSDGTNAPATTPDWDLPATGACGSCHDVTGQNLPDAHSKHVFDTDGPQLSCTTCHTHDGSAGHANAADHVNQFVDTVASMQANVCNSCHGVDGAEVAPDWKVAGSDDCVTCHSGASLSTIGVQAPDKSTALFSGHNLAAGNYPVSGYAAANQTCEACHDKAQPHLAGSGNKRLKAAFSCDTCHGTSGTASVNNINTHQAKACLTCHDPHGTSNIYMVKAASADYSGTVAFSARTGANSFDEADASNADDICATCHTAANQTVQHNNKENVGVHAGGSKQGADCLTCHKQHTDPVNAFAVGAGTSCDGCHGFPPATGVHAQHSITTVNTDAEDRSDCAVCHTGADSYTYDPAADQGNSLNHSNATNRPIIVNAAVGYNTTDQTCASACHTSTVGNGGTWTNGATLACDACHYYEASPTSLNNTAAGAKALTGTHNTHFDASKTCADCHSVPGVVPGHITVATSGTDAAKITGKATATMDEADILGSVGSDVDPGNATCSNIACHDASDDGHTATWTVANAVGCAFCHSDTDPATNNHTAHMDAALSTTFGLTIACTDCHVDNGANTAHLDGTVDLTGTKVSAYTSPNCTNSCHQDGRNGAAAVTATWGMVPQADCTICHTQQPATGSHAVHIADGANCANCHDNTVENTTAATQHLDLNIDAFDAAPADLGYPADKVLNTAFTTCNAAACHSDGRGTLVTTPDWGTSSACTECHAAAPATGSHTVHLAVSGVACADCHAGTTQGVAAGAGHRDNNVDTNAGLEYGVSPFTNKTINTAFTTCAAASCHDNGLNVTVTTPTWGTAVNDCSECHLTQPGTGSHTVHLASGAACGDCHDGAVEGTTAPAQHGDNNVDVYDVTAGDLGYPQNVAKGVGTWTTCNTASCHNDGQSGNNADLGNVGASNVTTPQWGTASNCNECHVAPPTSAKHDEHLGYGATCADCHAGAVYDELVPANSTGGANHRNGTIDVRAALNYNAAGAPGNGWGSCNNPAGLAGACHGTSDVRPWDGSTGGCTACHGQSGTTGEPLVAGDMMSTNPLGQHNTHVNTEGYSCNTCHNGHGMPTIDDKITIAFTGLASGGSYNPPGQWTTGKWLYNQTSTTATQDCSNLYCHSSGQPDGGGAGAPTYATPDWGNAASGACGTCHSATDPATGSHTAHINDGATCNSCHSSNIHVNQQVEVTTGTYTSSGAVGNGYGTCSTASCHDDGTGANATTPTWGTSASCTECHTLPMASGSHTKHLSASVGASCTDCHASGTNPATDSAPSVGHRDTNIDVLNSLGYPQNKTKGSAYASCATASCHVTNRNTTGATPVWGTTITGLCTECHTTPPSGDTHTTHLNAQANSIFGQAIGCGDCHDAATNPATDTPPAAGHKDGNIDAAGGYPAKVITDATYKSCNAASCHQTGQAVPSYVTTSNFNIDDANCTQCHTDGGLSASHAKHIVSNDCSACHTGATQGTSYSLAAHGDGNVDVAVGGYTANKTYGAAKESCASISCHSDGLSGTPGGTPVWGTAAGCNACHSDEIGSALTTGSHADHLNSTIMANITCSACHNTADPSTSTPPAQHSDGNVDVFASTVGDLGYPQDAAIGTGSWATGTCNAASCHDDGTGSLITTQPWNTNITDCSQCHANQPTTNAHGTHMGLTGVSCGTCHSGAVQGSDAGANHLNNQVDVLFGYTDTTKGAPYGTCSTSCHSDGTGAAGTSPAWNLTITNCNACHAAQPATPSHTAHFNDPVLSISCGDCHAGATVNVTGGPAHVDGDIDTIASLGYPQNQAYTAALGTCNNASCHTDGTGNTVTTPTWGTSSTCNECHTTPPTTGAHTTHLNAATNGMIGSLTCVNCHSDATTTSAPSAGHRDGNIDLSSTATYTGTPTFNYPANLGYTNVASTATAYNTETCGTSYCHGDNMPKGTTSGTTNAPTWGRPGGSTGCIFCHDVTAGTPAIAAHNGKTFTDCITCHDNTNAAGTGFVDPSLHINGNLEGGGDNCFDCHANVGSGLSGAHAAHNTVAFTGKLSTNDYGNAASGWYNVTYSGGKPSFGCGFCHPSTVAGHMTKQTSLNPADAGAAGTVKAMNDPSAAYSAGSCSATYCHSDGVNVASSSSPVWTGSVSGNCTDCHGNSPTSNAHSVHTVGIHYTDLYDSDRNGVMQAAAATSAAHGNAATATTITCVICHGDTVTLVQNDQNDVCTTCHSGASTKGNLGIGTSSVTHVNGQKDVAFNLSGFKTTAQLRDDITGVTSLNSNWTRTNGYKQASGLSHDSAKASTPNFTAGSCSAIVCHNGQAANWTDPVAGNCQKCHTELPQ